MNEISNSTSTCPQCGAALATDATAGLCPRCLLAEAMVPTRSGAEPATPAKTLLPEEIAPHFLQLEILECLGRGGMGVVYKARQKSLNRFVALKLLAPERVTDAKFAQRFTHEAQALAALNHPNIVTIYDFGQAGGFYFLLMEFVDGVNLRQAMTAGRFTPEQALAVVPPVCEALQYAHEHGIVHRDIKPENLLLDKEGRVKIADFGIAKMLGGDGTTASPDQPPAGATENEGTLASAAGTPQYMAPEQKAHRATDHRADIYSLGVVLYELLTGELPADQLQPPSRKVQVDVRLDEIVLRALEAQPDRRYQTAGEFRTQLVTMTSGASVPPLDPSVAAAPSRFSRTAIAGTCWAASSIFAALVLIRLPFPFLNAAPAWTASQLNPIIQWLLIPGFTAPLGTTVLGWIAIARIRRSAGKLHGLWLAVFDGLLFPLLAIDVLIIKADLSGRTHVVGPGLTPGVTMTERIIPGSVVLLLVVVIMAVDLLIIRAVWRAVHKGLADDDAARPPFFNTPRDYLALCFAALSGTLGALTALYRLTGWGGVMGLLTLGLALLAILLALPLRKSWAGWSACGAGSLNVAIWLIVAAVASSQLRTIRGASQTAMRDANLSFSPVTEREMKDKEAIDFDSGKRSRLPEFDSADKGSGRIGERVAQLRLLRQLEHAAGSTWMEQQQMDALFASHSLNAFGMKVCQLENQYWDEMIPSELNKLISGFEPRTPPQVLLDLGKGSPATYAFQTHQGGRGILQVIAITDTGMKLRYKLLQSGAALATNASSTNETWSPALTPGEKPDLERIRAEAQELASNGRYEEALQRHLWFHDHALEVDPAYAGVRLSFALSDWVELARHFPKAKQVLIEIRDHKTREIAAGRGHFDLFMDVDSINNCLQDSDATYTLFKALEPVDKALAKQCYLLMEDRLMQRGEYEVCLAYVGDPQKRFEFIRMVFETSRESPDETPKSLQDHLRDNATKTFVTNTCRLIEILVATNRKADAEKIRDQAVVTLDDGRLKSAVSDAERKLRPK